MRNSNSHPVWFENGNLLRIWASRRLPHTARAFFLLPKNLSLDTTQTVFLSLVDYVGGDINELFYGLRFRSGIQAHPELRRTVNSGDSYHEFCRLRDGHFEADAGDNGGSKRSDQSFARAILECFNARVAHVKKKFLCLPFRADAATPGFDSRHGLPLQSAHSLLGFRINRRFLAGIYFFRILVFFHGVFGSIGPIFGPTWAGARGHAATATHRAQPK